MSPTGYGGFLAFCILVTVLAVKAIFEHFDTNIALIVLIAFGAGYIIWQRKLRFKNLKEIDRCLL